MLLEINRSRYTLAIVLDTFSAVLLAHPVRTSGLLIIIFEGLQRDCSIYYYPIIYPFLNLNETIT